MKSPHHRATRTRRPARAPRHGLTLFELLLALAIFLVSLAALAQLLASGSRAAAQAKLQTEAILRCESKMNELVSGILPIEADASGVFDDDPRWSWRSTVSQGPWPDLQQVNLQVSRSGQNLLGNSSYSLRRFVRDPKLFVNAGANRNVGIPIQPGRRVPSQPVTRPVGETRGEAEPEDSDQ